MAVQPLGGPPESFVCGHSLNRLCRAQLDFLRQRYCAKVISGAALAITGP
jgi:hypothetical protein